MLFNLNAFVLVNERTSEVCQSKTLIEKLQYLLDIYPMPIKEDKCIETQLSMIDKCIGDDDKIDVEDENTNAETNTSKVLDNPSLNDIVSCNFSKAEEMYTVNNTTSLSPGKNESTQSSPCLSPKKQVISNSVSTPNCSIIEKIKSHTIEMNEQNCSIPSKQIEETKNCVKPTLQHSPLDIHNQFALYVLFI